MTEKPGPSFCAFGTVLRPILTSSVSCFKLSYDSGLSVDLLGVKKLNTKNRDNINDICPRLYVLYLVLR